MTDWNKRMQDSGLLAPGETVLATTLVAPAGKLVRNASFAIGGLVGVAVAAHAAKKRAVGPDEAVQGWAQQLPPFDGLLVVTDQRFLLARNKGALVAKPSELIAAFSFADVAHVEHERAKVANIVRVWFSDGSVLVCDAPKMTKPEQVAEALQRCRGAHAAH